MDGLCSLLPNNEQLENSYFIIEKKVIFFLNLGFEPFWSLKGRKKHMLYTGQIISRVTEYVFWGEDPSKS